MGITPSLFLALHFAPLDCLYRLPSITFALPSPTSRRLPGPGGCLVSRRCCPLKYLQPELLVAQEPEYFVRRHLDHHYDFTRFHLCGAPFARVLHSSLMAVKVSEPSYSIIRLLISLPSPLSLSAPLPLSHTLRILLHGPCRCSRSRGWHRWVSCTRRRVSASSDRPTTGNQVWATIV